MRGKKKLKETVGMNSSEIFTALAMLEKERGIPQTFMMEKIIQAITTAYKRDHDGVENVIVDVDEDHQTLKMFVQKNVVDEEDYVDPANEMTLEEAKAISAKVCPRRAATPFSACNFSTNASVSISGRRKCPTAIRESLGIPCR